IPNPAAAEAKVRAEREHLEWLAQISPRHEHLLRKLQSEEAEARRQREELEWLATISEKHERPLRQLQAAELEAQRAQQAATWFSETSNLQEANWDPAKHPRGGFQKTRVGFRIPAEAHAVASRAEEFWADFAGAAIRSVSWLAAKRRPC